METTNTTSTESTTSTEQTSPITTENTDSSSQDLTKSQVQALKEKFKLVVDGEEIEEEVDWNDKEGMKKRLQLAAAAKKRMTEAVEAKRKAFEIVKAFENDPESMLARMGPKGREIAEKYLVKQLQDEMLSPEEKELRDLKAYRESKEKEELTKKEQEQLGVQQKREMEYAQQFQTTIITALEKSGLPKTPELVKRMAATMQKNLEYGLELTPEDLVMEVKSDLTKIVKSIIGDSDGDSLIGLLGDDVAKKIRQSDIRKLQEKQSQLFQGGKKSATSSSQSQQESRPMTMDEWKESVNRRLQSK